MADSVACLQNGKLLVIREGHEPEELASPHAQQIARRERTAGRRSARRTAVLGARRTAPVPPCGRADQDLDFSFGDEAFTCTVEGKAMTSAIGVLAEDGKSVRTVSEGARRANRDLLSLEHPSQACPS